MSSLDRIQMLKRMVKEQTAIEEWMKEIYTEIQNVLSLAIQRGSETTDASGDKTVTFPTPYAVAPLVFLQGVDAGAKGIVLDVVSKSATQFVVKARKVTGITSGSGTAHSHSFSDSFNTSYVSAGTPTGTISSMSAGTPSGTISTVPDHHHSHLPEGTLGAPSAYITGCATGIVTDVKFAATVSGGSPTQPFYALTDYNALSLPHTTHVHTFTGSITDTSSIGQHNHTFTGSAMSAHSHTFTGSAMGTHRHSGSVSGTTGTESSHTHTVAAPVLAIDFNWFAIKA